jgi:reactive intermediate/imine deaminase
LDLNPDTGAGEDAKMEQLIEHIRTDQSPAPAGHYAQGTRWGDLIFVSGQLPVQLRDQLPAASFEEQARIALRNMLAIAEAGGASVGTMLKVNAYIVGIEYWPAFNQVFAELFGEARPARAVIPVPELHHGYLVEVDAVAVRAT